MDFSELTKTVVDRVRKLEPENFRRIIGFILLNEPSEPEMIELAYSPENTLLARIDEAKTMLATLSPSCSAVSSKKQSDTFSSAFHWPAQFLDHHLASDQPPLCDNSSEFAPQAYPDSTEESFSIFDQSQLLNLEENYLYSDATLGGCIPSRTSRRSPSLPEFPIKACHYFFKGYCKHGANCRYFHGHSFPEGYSAAFSPSLNDLQIEEHGFSPGSLEKLEMEIADLLRSRRGMPVSIASLPMLYYEKYGKNLQADGYLTESQRHGKAGFSLTKLLARLKSSIRLIDRPHGQHSVILAEDVSKFLECRNERSEQGLMAASAHQIYLTFPSESTFTEDDVSNYFKQFGPVRDVRIPCQEKRMFGFVSFVYSETVSEILMKRIPHFICGARVLVKPYREKTRMVDRMYNEKIKSAMYYTSQYADLDSELNALPREFESSRELKLHLEEQERLLELERTRFSDFSLLQRPLNQQSYFSHDIGNLKLQFPDEFPLEDHFSYTLEPLHSGSSTEDNDRSTSSNYNQLESCPIELPESPFAFPPPVGSSIPTVI